MILNRAKYKVGWSIPPDTLSNARPVHHLNKTNVGIINESTKFILKIILNLFCIIIWWIKKLVLYLSYEKHSHLQQAIIKHQ